MSLEKRFKREKMRKSIGIDLIRNDELRQHLEYLPGGLARPIDLDLMRNDVGLRSNLLSYIHLVGLSVNAYEMTQETSLALMDMIKKELKP